MIDIETLSTKMNSLIVSIGAIKFNPRSEDLDIDKMDKFYCLIDIEESKSYNFDIDENCLKWWDKQPEDIKNEILYSNINRVKIKDALLSFNTWYNSSNVNNVWSQGINFDFPILENAYNCFNINVPWKYWSVRDSRTLCEICKIKKSTEFNNKSHHPIYDCFRQVISVQKAFKRIK